MRCIVTAGPTFEPLDEARRLTNFSTGRLGTELAAHLHAQGHEVILFIGAQSAFPGERRANRVESFTTTRSLIERFEAFASPEIDAVFHAAAVSDFTFGQVWERGSGGELVPVRSGKYSTRRGALLAELVPTPKVIYRLRGWFSNAVLVGWKYEVEGDQSSVVQIALEQLRQNRTQACVVNGSAYGPGFGLVTEGQPVRHLRDHQALFQALECLLARS